eukprot:GHVO01016390.1.p1 GENE.GHVO01016390.1~~GHVO01016390.1.p1  ORF type:complete len:563 (+),score=104.90 GHVO01016390.1:64-1689(+)
MDAGTDAVSMLKGTDVPLRLGYVAVKNRSQLQVDSHVTMDEARWDETRYFNEHPKYGALPPALLGTKSLIDRLTKVLYTHLRSYLPDIKKEISDKIALSQTRLYDLGDNVPIDIQDKIQLMWAMVADYCDTFKNTIKGKHDKRLMSTCDIVSDIPSGSHIRLIFNDLLEEYIDRGITEDTTDLEIDQAICIHEGDSLPGFPSPDIFEYLLLPHLQKILPPVMECLDRAAAIMENLAVMISMKILHRFPDLSEQVTEHFGEILTREKANTRGILESIVAAQTGYLFTNDSKYLAEHGSMIGMPQSQPKQTDTAQSSPAQPLLGKASQALSSMGQNVSAMMPGKKLKTRYSEEFLSEIRFRLDAYFGLVIRNVRDIVPKTIGYFLVRQIQDKLQFEIYNELNSPAKLAELLSEPPHIAEERKELLKQTKVLKSALLVLQKDPNLSHFPVGDDLEIEQEVSALRTTTEQGTSGAVQPSPNAQPRLLPSTQQAQTRVPMAQVPHPPQQSNVPPPSKVQGKSNKPGGIFSNFKERNPGQQPLFDGI